MGNISNCLDKIKKEKKNEEKIINMQELSLIIDPDKYLVLISKIHELNRCYAIKRSEIKEYFREHLLIEEENEDLEVAISLFEKSNKMNIFGLLASIPIFSSTWNVGQKISILIHMFNFGSKKGLHISNIEALLRVIIECIEIVCGELMIKNIINSETKRIINDIFDNCNKLDVTEGMEINWGEENKFNKYNMEIYSVEEYFRGESDCVDILSLFSQYPVRISAFGSNTYYTLGTIFPIPVSDKAPSSNITNMHDVHGEKGITQHNELHSHSLDSDTWIDLQLTRGLTLIPDLGDTNINYPTYGTNKFDLAMQLTHDIAARNRGIDIPQLSLHTPHIVENYENIKYIDGDSNKFHTLMLSSNGGIYSCGINLMGILGRNNGEMQKSYMMMRIEHLKEIKIAQVACGRFHSLALTQNGVIYSWGSNNYGQLGISTNRSQYTAESSREFNTSTGKLFHYSSTPQKIGGVLEGIHIKQIEGGKEFSVVLSLEKKVYSWGKNNYGQVGRRGGKSVKNIEFYDSPQEVDISESIIDISCGADYTMTRSTKKNIYFWGRNKYCIAVDQEEIVGRPTEIGQLKGAEITKMSTNGYQGYATGPALRLQFQVSYQVPTLIKIEEKSGDNEDNSSEGSGGEGSSGSSGGSSGNSYDDQDPDADSEPTDNGTSRSSHGESKAKSVVEYERKELYFECYGSPIIGSMLYFHEYINEDIELNMIEENDIPNVAVEEYSSSESGSKKESWSSSESDTESPEDERKGSKDPQPARKIRGDRGALGLHTQSSLRMKTMEQPKKIERPPLKGRGKVPGTLQGSMSLSENIQTVGGIRGGNKGNSRVSSMMIKGRKLTEIEELDDEYIESKAPTLTPQLTTKYSKEESILLKSTFEEKKSLKPDTSGHVSRKASIVSELGENLSEHHFLCPKLISLDDMQELPIMKLNEKSIFMRSYNDICNIAQRLVNIETLDPFQIIIPYDANEHLYYPSYLFVQLQARGIRIILIPIKCHMEVLEIVKRSDEEQKRIIQDLKKSNLKCKKAEIRLTSRMEENRLLYRWGHICKYEMNNINSVLKEGKKLFSKTEWLSWAAKPLNCFWSHVFVFPIIEENDMEFNYKRILEIQTGKNHAAIMLEDGGLLLYGDNSYGQLGVKDRVPPNTYFPPPFVIHRYIQKLHHKVISKYLVGYNQTWIITKKII